VAPPPAEAWGFSPCRVRVATGPFEAILEDVEPRPADRFAEVASKVAEDEAGSSGGAT
jgi:hypothetical protein